MKRTAAVGCFVTLLLASATAYADIFAAVCVVAPAPRTDLDIAILHASTGFRTALPTGVNTTADEIHPSITPDGGRLVFARVNLGTIRIIVVDLSTGVMSDLFTATEVATNPPLGPAITPDGATVVTGGRSGNGSTKLTLTSLRNFPTGPYDHDVREFPFGPISESRVDHVAAGGSGKLAAGDTSGNVYLVKKDGTFGDGSDLIGATGFSFSKLFARPAMAANSPQLVFFEEHGPVDNVLALFNPGDIVFRPATLADFGSGPPTKLPAIVNTSRDESQPAVTADGRYLAFVRDSATSGDFLFVFDTQTQTLLNTRGVSLGGDVHTRGGSVSLFSKTLLNTSVISSSGNLTFSLAATSGVGILVQRIVGRTTFLDRPAYELEFVGRVPLGTFPEGHSNLLWDLTVNDEPLAPGRYLVTLRAVEGTIARELGRPHVLVIPDRH